MNLLPQISDRSTVELAELSASELQQLQQHVDAFAQQVKFCKERLAGAISLKYDVRASAIRQSQAKETGVIRFDDDGISIVADIAKRPQWDQKKLSEIAQRVRINGEDPLEFMAITYKVPESKYKAWPEHLKSIFRDARTVKHSPQSFVLSVKEGKL